MRPRPCRLIVDSPADGAWNMAIDDVLLTAASERGEATLRFYGWKQPTLSLGYFQKYESREAHEPSRNCPAVRRASGGGAILHDRELTYSLALPHEFWPEREHTQLYQLMHDLLCEALTSLGIKGAVRYGAQEAKPCEANPFAEERPSGERFLCFNRRTEHDVVLNKEKIAGSAQRKRRGAILQHGSILLARSAHAPTLPGIAEASGIEISPPQLIRDWQSRIATALEVGFASEPHPPETLAAADEINLAKFASNDWLSRR
jgi:lipoate-protein ligase A